MGEQGGIGVTAIQLAKAFGAKVIATTQLCDVQAETDGNEARSQSSIGRPPH
jgi:D-arabinose 1-dehydrogenase-like Zn-dependent alcohol dehydrogenase